MSGDHDRAMAIKNTTHYCPDWDGLKISCEDDEYERCTCPQYNGKSTWVGLEDLYEVNKFYSDEFLAGAEWAEAKLKEKNA